MLCSNVYLLCSLWDVFVVDDSVLNLGVHPLLRENLLCLAFGGIAIFTLQLLGELGVSKIVKTV